MSCSRARLWNFLQSLYDTELTETSPRAPTPPWLKTQLLPHQQTSLAAALALEASKCNGLLASPLPADAEGGLFFASYGILSDRVGSGKSLVALALMKADPPPPFYTEFVSRNAYVMGDGRDTGLLRKRTQLITNDGTRLTPTTCSLLIVPHALIDQWTTYLDRDTTLRYKVVARKLDALRETLFTDLDSHDLLIVSSTMWNLVKERGRPETGRPTIKTIQWRRVFIDEADSISFSSGTNDLHALFYWFITATYLNLVFSSGAMFNIDSNTMHAPLPTTPPALIARVRQSLTGRFYNVVGCKHRNLVSTMAGISSHQVSGLLPSSASHVCRLLVRNREDYVDASFRPPAILHTVLTCATPKTIHMLDSFISPDMMERLHAGDVGGALECVGMTSHSEEELVEAVTASWRRELDTARRTHDFKKTLEYSSEAAKAKAMEGCEAKIAGLESRIAAIQDRVKKAKEQACPICCEEATNPAVTPCCAQVFCFGCLCESLKRVAACPLCRERVTNVKAIKVLGTTAKREGDGDDRDKKEGDDKDKKKGKRETAIDYLKTLPTTSRTLIFSSYDASFSGLNDALRAAGLESQTVWGSQARVSKVLREFTEGKHTVLMLNARHMGAGLNIEAATHVMLFHKMSKELETQIIGRAVRLGRAAPLQVLHLLHDNEVRENVVTYN